MIDLRHLSTLSVLTLSLASSAFACGDSSAGDDVGDEATETADTSTTTETTETADTSTTTETTETADTSTTTETTETTGTEACSDTSVCAEPIPEGWQGPTMVSDIGCDGDYGQTLRPLQMDFDPGSWSCECECVPEGVACPSDGALGIWDTGTCDGDPGQTVALSEGSPCAALPAWPADATVAVVPSPVEGDCTAQLTETSVSPSFGAIAELCGPNREPQACGDGGLCVPTDASVCIWRPGDQDCPEGSYSEPLLGYGGYDLYQECSCECGQPSCTGTVSLQDDGCNELLAVAGDSCESPPADASRASFVAGSPANACGPGVVTKIGGAAPLDEVTVCCTP